MHFGWLEGYEYWLAATDESVLVRSHHQTIWWIAIVDDGSQKARVVEYEHILYYP